MRCLNLLSPLHIRPMESNHYDKQSWRFQEASLRLKQWLTGPSGLAALK